MAIDLKRSSAFGSSWFLSGWYLIAWFRFAGVVPFGGLGMGLGIGLGINDGLWVPSDAHVHHAGVLCVLQLWLLGAPSIMQVGIVDRGGYDDGEEQGERKGHNDKKGKMRDTGMTSQGGTRGKSADRDEDDPNGVN